MEKFNEMINDEQLTLVDFFATWCGPCKMMHPILEQLKEKMGDDIRILKVDVDKNEALSMQYRIQSVPTLMLFKKGEMLWRQSGAMSLNDLIRKFRSCNNSPAENEIHSPTLFLCFFNILRSQLLP